MRKLYVVMALNGHDVVHTEVGGVDDQLATLDIAPGICVRGNVSYAIPLLSR